MADDKKTLLPKIQQYEKFVNEVLRSKLKYAKSMPSKLCSIICTNFGLG